MKIKLSGIFAPIISPFDDNKEIDIKAMQYNLEKWITLNLDGVVLPGSNSEAAYLTREEKVTLWQTCAHTLQNTKTSFVAGTGVETTKESIELTKIVTQMGAKATLLLPPFYYKSQMTSKVLIKHYTEIADAAEIPILIYNVPAFTGIDFDLQTLITLSEHPNIIGIKDSSSNVIKMGGLMAKNPSFYVFAGTGSALLPFLSIGAVGGIMALANFIINPLQSIYNDFHAGYFKKAKETQLAIIAINNAVTAKYGVPGLKYAMNQCQFAGGFPRPPLLPLEEDKQKDIDKILSELQTKMDM